MADVLKRYIHEDGMFKAAVVETTLVGRKVFRTANPSPIALQLLTQAMTGALLLCTGLKDEGTLLFKFRGDGPMDLLTVEANTAGQTRGFAGQPGLDFNPDRESGLFHQAIGSGQLTVLRRVEPGQKTFTSVVSLVPGELAYNYAHYLLKSEQVPSALQLGAKLDPDFGVAAAGGVLIQALPGADQNLLFLLESRLGDIPSLGDLFAGEEAHEQIAEELFGPIPVQELASLPVSFNCSCTRQRVLQILARLPEEELQDMRADAKDVEVTCQFCGMRYSCAPEDLDVMLDLKGESKTQ